MPGDEVNPIFGDLGTGEAAKEDERGQEAWVDHQAPGI